ncbi:hypothetical protein SKAU_G00142000 [Synaphobranchus kaupii]|uniref:B30.2/SPRY domain-containing protein n=1 Tax=Synaphobranchus kaupii TaxID=118154 RepID=A0A9Q1FSX8_SYNKA|nr:hypothetical protein SKAU_G00142000 [Synaphobranchus kaupii]
MFQGSEASLSSVQRDFDAIKALAEAEKPKHNTKVTKLKTKPSEAKVVEAEEGEKDHPSEDCAGYHRQLESTVCLMREMLSLQEVEMVELKELVLSHQAPSESTQHLRDQLSQMKNELKASVLELRGEVQELQQDREVLRRELGAVREELHLRDRTVQSLREQLQSLKSTCKHQAQTPDSQPSTSTLTETNPVQIQPIPTSTPTLTETSPAAQSQKVLTATPQPSTERDVTPAPSATEAHTAKEATATPPKATPTEAITSKQSPKSKNKTNNYRDAEIVILIDSNGKFLNEQQLFPNHRVVKLWCPKAENAFELLTKRNLGEPSHIIVHTGTNDLRTQQERVAESVRRVAERATQTFPSSKITISTILPRTDFHPQTIQRINAAISRGCAPMPNVHIAHHPTLRLECLHDHVHLQKGLVSILARTLKDVALGRSPSSPPRISRRPPSLHPAGLYFSPPQRDPTTQWPQHHHQRSPPRPRAPPAGHSYSNIKERAQCTLQDPELLSGVLIDVAKHLGNLKYRVWEKMLEMVQYNPVLLDPNTAFPWLSLSDDLTTVTYTVTEQKCPDNPERFSYHAIVLGSEGFTSGKHSWEVKVGDKPKWTIGVVKESITRKGKITYSPEGGFWAMMLRYGKNYRAAGVTDLTLKRKPQSIRVQLDYDRGEVSFFDSSDMSHIYTFTDTFTERVFPCFCPCNNNDGKNLGALQIWPVKVSVKNESN